MRDDTARSHALRGNGIFAALRLGLETKGSHAERGNQESAERRDQKWIWVPGP